MDISYKGASSLIISTKKTTLIIDPKVSDAGLKDPNVANAVELLTDDRYRIGTVIPDDDRSVRLIIDGPGEFEVGEFSIRGIAARRSIDDKDAVPAATMYRIENEEFRIGVLGHIAGKLSDEQLESLGVLDILIVPVGGNGFTLDPHDAAALARQIDPRVVIPVHYEDTGVKYEVPQLALENFTRELTVPVESPEKYKLKNASVLPETLTIVALARS